VLNCKPIKSKVYEMQLVRKINKSKKEDFIEEV